MGHTDSAERLTGVVVRVNPFRLIMTADDRRFFIAAGDKLPQLYIGNEVTFQVSESDAESATQVRSTGYAVHVDIKTDTNGIRRYSLGERVMIGSMTPWNDQYLWDRSTPKGGR